MLICQTPEAMHNLHQLFARLPSTEFGFTLPARPAPAPDAAKWDATDLPRPSHAVIIKRAILWTSPSVPSSDSSSSSHTSPAVHLHGEGFHIPRAQLAKVLGPFPRLASRQAVSSFTYDAAVNDRVPLAEAQMAQSAPPAWRHWSSGIPPVGQGESIHIGTTESEISAWRASARWDDCQDPNMRLLAAIRANSCLDPAMPGFWNGLLDDCGESATGPGLDNASPSPDVGQGARRPILTPSALVRSLVAADTGVSRLPPLLPVLPTHYPPERCQALKVGQMAWFGQRLPSARMDDALFWNTVALLSVVNQIRLCPPPVIATSANGASQMHILPRCLATIPPDGSLGPVAGASAGASGAQSSSADALWPDGLLASKVDVILGALRLEDDLLPFVVHRRDRVVRACVPRRLEGGSALGAASREGPRAALGEADCERVCPFRLRLRYCRPLGNVRLTGRYSHLCSTPSAPTRPP